jgi:hypothetical protein
MPDYAILRLLEQEPDGQMPSRDIGTLRLPAFRGPDPYHFLIHLRRVIMNYDLHPLSWRGGVRHDPKNTNGLTGSGDVWDLLVTLTPEPELEWGVESVLVEKVLPDIYARFIPTPVDALASEARVRRSAIAQLEHEDRWKREALTEVAFTRQPYGDWLFVYDHQASRATAYVLVSPQGAARGRLRTGLYLDARATAGV